MTTRYWYTPIGACDPFTTTCQRVFVSPTYDTCYDSCDLTCQAAADKYNGTLPMETPVSGGWGMPLSLLCDIFISMGLALQKVGHKRLKRKEVGTIFQQPPWILGLALMMCGEVGNLVAYGDRGTPTAVITAVGCIGLVANLFFATVFLKEPFRMRDMLGSIFVLMGVGLIVGFAPRNPAPLNNDSLVQYLSSAGAIVIYAIYGSLILLLFYKIWWKGATGTMLYLMLSALIGSFTVMASRTVAVFSIRSLEGLITGTFSDQLTELISPEVAAGLVRFESDVRTHAACMALSPGFGDGVEWKPVSTAEEIAAVDNQIDRTDVLHGCFFKGIGQIAYTSFWVCLVLLIVTAVMQVKYLNDALTNETYSAVIPYHYVFFTFFSVLGSIVLFQDFNVGHNTGNLIADQEGAILYIYLHFFVDGVMATFMGVYFITTNRETPDDDSEKEGADADGKVSTPFLDTTSVQERGGNLHADVDMTGASSGGDAPLLANVISIELDGKESSLPAVTLPAVPDRAAAAAAASPPPPQQDTPALSTAAAPPPTPPSLGDRGRQGSALAGLVRGGTRRLIMGGAAGSSDDANAKQVEATAPAAADPRSSRASALYEEPSAPAKRASMVDAMAEVLPVPKVHGFDARSPDDRQSRVSNVASFLSALGGGHQASFMFDPADRNKAAGPAKAEAEKATKTRGSASAPPPPSRIRSYSVPEQPVVPLAPRASTMTTSDEAAPGERQAGARGRSASMVASGEPF